jgi:uncharacterized protein (UPF0332 family)/predicted nucleotidyltransferase
MAPTKKSESKEQQSGTSQPFVDPRLPKEAQKRLEEIQKKLETFKDKLLDKFEGYITGVALLPPNKKPSEADDDPMQQQGPTMQQPQQPPNPDAINVLVLVDDTDSKKMSKAELKDKLTRVINQIAQDIDKNIEPMTLIYSELWQSCYDGKYDILQTVAMSAPVYDQGMLSAVKIAEVHKNMVLKKFEKYIVSYVLVGSLVQGRATPESDIDVFIVIDDTDVKKMTRAELKDKLRAIILGMGMEAGQITGIQNKINIQVYILTDFWESVKEANPVIFTFLRDGVPFYDRGIFMPWKQLLQMGKIRPSMEAIDLYMSSGSQVLDRVKVRLKEIGMEDFFWALITPSQATLMLYGIPPPTPKETPEVMREIFVKKEKILDEKYVKTLEKVIKLRKGLEHGSKTKVTGAEIDELLEECTGYLKRIDELAIEIEQKRYQEDVVHIHDSIIGMLRDILRLHNVTKVKEEDVVKKFEEVVVSEGDVPKKYMRTIQQVVKGKADYEAKKLHKAEVDKIRTAAQELIRFLIEYIQRKRGRELERTKIRVKHGDTYGEVIMLDNVAYIIHDIDAKEREVSKAKVTAEGGLGKIEGSSMEELEEAMAKVEIPSKTFIKHKVFGDLPSVFGKDVEVLVNY